MEKEESTKKETLPEKELPSSYRPKEESGKMVRLSDEELKEFRGIILKKIEETEFELLKVKLPRNSVKGPDLPSESLYKEQLDISSLKQRLLMRELSLALRRIENKTYGICTVTGKLIDRSRLKRIPYITTDLDDERDLAC